MPTGASPQESRSGRRGSRSTTGGHVQHRFRMAEPIRICGAASAEGMARCGTGSLKKNEVALRLQKDLGNGARIRATVEVSFALIMTLAAFVLGNLTLHCWNGGNHESSEHRYGMRFRWSCVTAGPRLGNTSTRTGDSGGRDRAQTKS